MSILARIMQLDPRIGPGRLQKELSADMDISAVREQAAQSAGVVAQREQEARLAALAEEEAESVAVVQDPDPVIPPTDPVVSPPTDEGKKETSRSTIIKNGRLVLQIIYNNGTTDEIDLGPSDPGVSDPPPPAPVTGDPQEQFNAREFAQANYSYLGEELLETFIGEYNTNGGDVDEALRTMRGTQAYKDKFPGIFREDGTTLRIDTDTPELDYIKIREDYGNLLQDYNLNPEYFEGQIQTLFENDVAPRVFEQRLNVAYNSLFPQFDAVKQYYVNNYPNIFPTTEDITDEAIFASFISEDVSADIIEQRVNVSQIGGAFLEQDFAISQEQAQRLVSAGLSGTGAQQLAARAETQLPRLQRLARRFTGREDIFGLSEFIESEVFGEGVADQVRERLEAEQATVFTREGGAAVTQAGVTGLVEQ